MDGQSGSDSPARAGDVERPDDNSSKTDSFKTYKKTNWRKIFLLLGACLITAGLIIAIVVPVCIENDCSGSVTTPSVPPSTTHKPGTTTTTESTTRRTPWTTRTTTPSTTTTRAPGTTLPPLPTTTTTRAPLTLPTIRTETTTTTTTTTSAAPTVPRNLTSITNSGPVVGHVIELTPFARSDPVSVVSYLGIPFAKPPVGPLRWKKPEPPTPWVDPLIANKHTPLCVQSGGTVRSTHPYWTDFQEDCLYLHIYSPLDSSNEPYPVMFWIYGGSYQSGGNVQYPGHFLAAKDVVVVTINYRLNIMGFASTGNGTVKGNFGLWDQRQALLWVEENIRAFGGDPKKITVFGESAGAASTGLVLASPTTVGHFQQAILESGNDYSIWAVNGPEVEPDTYIVQVAEQHNCTPETSGGTVTNDDEMMECLRPIDANTLRRTRFTCPFCLGFAPVVDGEGGYLPKMPLDLRLERQSNEIPIMHGNNRDECTIFLVAEDETLLLRGVNRTEFEFVMRGAVDYFDFAFTEPNRKEDLYESLNWFYSPWPLIDNGKENKIALSNACLDMAFVAPATDQIRHHSRFAKAYQYMFGYEPQPVVPPARLIPDWIGVPHAVELGYTWGYPFIAKNEDVLRDAGNLTLDLGFPIVFSQQDEEWAEFMMTLWTNFAKYGNPTPSPVNPPSGMPPVVWEEFTPDSQKYFHMEKDDVGTKENYRSLETTFWHNYGNNMTRGADLHNPFGFPEYVPYTTTTTPRSTTTRMPPSLLPSVSLPFTLPRRSTTPTTTTTSTTTTPTPAFTTTTTPTPIKRGVTVTTKYGDVVGHVIKVEDNKNVVSYLGVPFAKPPVGDLRWKKPEEPDNWASPYVADKLKPICIQSPVSVQITHVGWDQFSEDCLYLNVYTPEDSARDPYPVMVWIYGGAYQFGGNIQYPGHFIAAKDVVMVTMNYRINIFGFLSTDDPGTDSNYGLWDQHLALKWVNENIGNFGGDPSKVTVFGESAGSASTGLSLLSPHTKDLVHQGILQSGSDLSVWAVNGPEVLPETYVYGVSDRVGCGNETDNAAMLDCMRQVDPETLRKTRPQCPGCLGFAPVVDGPNGYLPKMPRELRMDGEFHKVPVMLGTNHDECNIFLPGIDPTLLVRGINRTEFEAVILFVIDSLGFALTGEGSEEDIFQALNWFYSPWGLNDHGQENKKALGQTCTDIAFVAPGNEFLQYYARENIPAFQYNFHLSVEARIVIPVPDWIGTPHMWDLPYVFGYPLIDEADEELQIDTGNLSIPALRYNAVDRAWSDYIITMWTNFAKFGTPTPAPLVPPSADDPVWWLPHTVEHRNYLYIQNDVTEGRENLRPLETAYWNNYLNWMARGGATHHPWNWNAPNTTSSRKPQMRDPTNIFDLEKLINLALGYASDNKMADLASHKYQAPKPPKQREMNELMAALSKPFDMDSLKRAVKKYAEIYPEILSPIGV